MTRFGRWFAGAVLLAMVLFVVGLLIPRDRSPVAVARDQDSSPPALARDAAGPRLMTSSGLVMPVANVRARDLADTFGDPRGAAGERGHGALDIMAPRGTPVLAAAGGTIEKVFKSELGGHTIYIRSPNRRNVYYYAHLDTYAPGVREGAKVGAGQRIGTVGSTGDADPAGPHLHFEIKRVSPQESWHQGRPINPYPLLAGRPAGV